MTFVSMSLIYPILNGIFRSQNAPKVLLDSNKNIILIMESYKLHKIERKSARSRMGSKTQILHFWNNFSKLNLKSYIRALQHGMQYSV